MRIAADCGNLLYEKALRSPDNPHLLNQAAQHYRACLSHEPTCRNAEALFRDARARLGQIERMAAQREGARSGGGERKSPAEKDVEGGTPRIEATTPVEKPSVEKDEQKMVGPDGVIYKRSDKR